MSGEFQFGACETSMQAQRDNIFTRLEAHANKLFDKVSEYLCVVPGHCKLAMLSIIVALFVASLLAPIWTFLVSIIATLAMYHGYMLCKRRQIAPVTTVEKFYNNAPHDMVVMENPVFAHEEDLLKGRNDDMPWKAGADEIAVGVQEMQDLTPPNLLDAAQTNEVPHNAVGPEAACLFPTAFPDLGERFA